MISSFNSDDRSVALKHRASDVEYGSSSGISLMEDPYERAVRLRKADDGEALTKTED